MRIRDPIHGTIPVDDREKAVIDHPFYQRLRHVKQLGFGDLAFPGATHTRHAHSLGAMHVSSRLFDVVSARADLSSEARCRFRAAVRLAVLCHDLGHMPLSHASEAIAPARGTLRLPGWLADQGGELASHEDFTAKILLDSSLGEVIEKHFAGDGVPAEALVALITGSEAPGGIRFSDRGVDWTPLLRAIVSGALEGGGVRLRGFPAQPLPHVHLRLLSPHASELRSDAPSLLPGSPGRIFHPLGPGGISLLRRRGVGAGTAPLAEWMGEEDRLASGVQAARPVHRTRRGL